MKPIIETHPGHDSRYHLASAPFQNKILAPVFGNMNDRSFIWHHMERFVTFLHAQRNETRNKDYLLLDRAGVVYFFKDSPISCCKGNDVSNHRFVLINHLLTCFNILNSVITKLNIVCSNEPVASGRAFTTVSYLYYSRGCFLQRNTSVPMNHMHMSVCLLP